MTLLEQGSAELRDLETLTPIAQVAGLPWFELFPELGADGGAVGASPRDKRSRRDTEPPSPSRPERTKPPPCVHCGHFLAEHGLDGCAAEVFPARGSIRRELCLCTEFDAPGAELPLPSPGAVVKVSTHAHHAHAGRAGVVAWVSGGRAAVAFPTDCAEWQLAPARISFDDLRVVGDAGARTEARCACGHPLSSHFRKAWDAPIWQACNDCPCQAFVGPVEPTEAPLCKCGHPLHSHGHGCCAGALDEAGVGTICDCTGYVGASAPEPRTEPEPTAGAASAAARGRAERKAEAERVAVTALVLITLRADQALRHERPLQSEARALLELLQAVGGYGAIRRAAETLSGQPWPWGSRPWPPADTNVGQAVEPARGRVLDDVHERARECLEPAGDRVTTLREAIRELLNQRDRAGLLYGGAGDGLRTAGCGSNRSPLGPLTALRRAGFALERLARAGLLELSLPAVSAELLAELDAPFDVDTLIEQRISGGAWEE